MSDLGRDLRDLGRHLDARGEEAFRAEIMSAVRQVGPLQRRPAIRKVWIAVAGAALALAAGLGAPAVAEWLSVRVGGVDIRNEPGPAPLGGALDLGVEVDAGEADAAVPGALRRLGGAPPASIWLDRIEGIPVVSMVYPPSATTPASSGGVGVLLQQFGSPMAAAPLMTKFAGPNSTVEEVSVAGSRGAWVEGAHGIGLRLGPDVVFVAARLAANTLVWESDGVTYRLEAAVDRERALALARSLR